MKTPDGQEFPAGRKKPGLSVRAGLALLAGLKALGRFGLVLLRLAGKFIATVWRLAGALDEALWRGAKLFAHTLWRSAVAVLRVLAMALDDLAGWLPSRSGRAYSAGAGIILIIASLWIIDDLRAPSSPYGEADDAGGRPVDADDPIVARIEGRYVHLSEVTAAARASGALRRGETLTPKTAFDRDLVRAYVEQRLLARAAVDEGLQRSPQVARQIAVARERILAAAYMDQRLAQAVTDEAVKRLYDAEAGVTRLGDEVRARQIVVRTGEEAEALIEKLKEGADFASLARRYSIDRSTASNGGEIGYFTREMMEPALAAAAFSTPVGSIATPFETEFGWHVLEVEDRRATQGVPFAAVRDNIRRFLTLRTIEATVNKLKEENDVVYYPPSPPADDGAEAASGAPAGRG